MISSIKTDVGKHRPNNEDAFYIPKEDVNLPKLFIVADGMGGHQGGEIASKLAVKEVSEYINKNIIENLAKSQVRKIIKDSLIIANEKILKCSMKTPNWHGMGTTITMALFQDNLLYIGHVGDSRAYRIRDNEIDLLTEDDSIVWELMTEGKITLAETKTHPMKNVITKALGTEQQLKPDLLEFDIKKGDIIILCSDGLTNMLDEDKIKEIACKYNPHDAVDELIKQANKNGGIDNITVGIIRADQVGM